MPEIAIPDGLTREDLLRCLDRELRYREHVFPRRVAAKKMTIQDSLDEMSKMRAVRAVIAQLPPTQPRLPFDRRGAP